MSPGVTPPGTIGHVHIIQSDDKCKKWHMTQRSLKARTGPLQENIGAGTPWWES